MDEQMKDKKAILTLNGEVRAVSPGCLLSLAIGGEMPCGGHGKCGKCRVIARGALSPISDAEKRLLPPEALARGVRLACLTYIEGDCTVETDADAPNQILAAGTAAEINLSPTFSAYGAAVDIGTTTLAARLFDRTGACIAEATRLNPQASHGADVISRIDAALGGQGGVLARALCAALDEMFVSLADAAGIAAEAIDRIVITGNTVMLHLLTETSVEPLSHAPFAVERRFGETVSAAALGLAALDAAAQVYLPPCIAAFVGADTVCALLASGLCRTSAPGVLVDIGTNGEMAISAGERLWVCSTAAGPAFEGVGISMGMRGAEGAIDAVTLVNGGLAVHTIGGGRPQGICGSGLVDAVACLLDLGELDETGFMEEEPAVIAPPVVLTQQDIRALQLAKSAICAGIKSLQVGSGLSSDALTTVKIAGGFGSYLNFHSAARIGLIPAELAGKAEVIGNAALAGASMLLLDAACTAECRQLADRAQVTQLAADPVFAEAYMTGMLF